MPKLLKYCNKHPAEAVVLPAGQSQFMEVKLFSNTVWRLILTSQIVEKLLLLLLACTVTALVILYP